MHPSSLARLSLLALGLSLPASVQAQEILTLTEGTRTFASLANTAVTMSGSSELRLTSATPLTASTIDLTSENAWIFLTGVRPETTLANYLSMVRVNGVPAEIGTNVRLAEYGLGSVIIPHSASFTPLVAYTGNACTGQSMAFSLDTYYTSTGAGPGGVTLPVIALGAMDRTISSFRLKRGYMATLSAKPDGTGASQNYIAQDGDLEVGLLPANLDNAVQFVRVFPWRWVNKKGACDVAPDLLNTTWWYNWNNSNESVLNREYVPTWQQPFWPGQPTNRTTVTHHLGLNEPNGPDQDAYKNLSPPGSVDNAAAIWPVQLATGLRAGSPAVTDGGYSWISNFTAQVNAAGHRMDFVPIHYYRASNNDPASAAASMYAFLKSVYDVVKRPMWVTEFNNGANWTTGTDPTLEQNRACIEAMIKMMDETPWIERYSVYSAVESVRQMVVSGTNPVELTPAGTMYRDHVSPLSYVQAIPATGGRGVSRLAFEGDTRDASGFSQNGLAAKSPSYAAGRRGQAVRLDGVDNFVQLPAGIASSTSFTFASWVYWEGGAASQRIFDFGDNLDSRAGSYKYLFLSPNAGGFLRLGVRNGADATQVVQTAAPLPANSWQHVAVTISGTTARIYVNGVQQATGAITTPALTGTPYNYLGKSQWPTDPMFKGLLDEVHIFDSALTATQVAALMNNAAPQFASATINGGAALQGQAYTGTVAGQATDPDGDAVDYSKAGGPAWLQVAADGTLSGTPAATDQGTHDFTLVATDTAGATGFTVLSITLPKVNGNGAWASAGGGNWSDATKWADAFPANGSGFRADFSALAANAPATVTLDSARTVGSLLFGNSVGGGNWTLAAANGATLTLDSASQVTAPAIDVAANTVTISTPLAGAAGVSKAGSGTLVLAGSHPLAGIVDIDSGSASAAQGVTRLVGPGGLPAASELRIRTNNSGSSTLELDGSAGSVSVAAALTLSGRNSNTLAVRNLAGDNALRNGLAMGSGGANYLFQSDAGTLTLGGSIRATMTGTRNLTLMGAGNGAVSGIVSNGVADTFNVVKSGTGKWSLDAANTYNGATTVNGGELVVNGKTGAGTTTVASGATLSGGGTIGAALNAASGSKVRVGRQGFALVPDTKFSLVDNFESYPTGNIGAVPNTTSNVWTGVFDGTANARIVDVSGNRAMAVNGINAAADSWRGAVSSLKTPLPDGQTGTYFFRVRSTGATTTDFIFGLSDQAASTTTAPGNDVADPWNEYAVTLSIAGGNLRAYGEGLGDVTIAPVTTNGWINVWLVVDNAAKTFRVASSTGNAAGTLAAPTFSFGRRTAATTAGKPLVTFGLHERANVAGQLDDLHFAPGSDLANPLDTASMPVVARAATLNVAGDFTLAAGATLELDVSSPALHDKLAVAGAFNASGTLKVSLDAAQPAPALGASFDLFDAATSAVGFASLDLPALPAGLTWNTGEIATGVLSVVSAPAGYSSWAAANGITGEPANGDFDHDGLSNLLEYALGLNPVAPDRTPGLIVDGSSQPTVTFSKGSLAAADADLVYTLESSPTLGAEPHPWTPVTPTVNDAATISYTLPAGHPAVFIRLVVTRR